jgi:hypothetical protein
MPRQINLPIDDLIAQATCAVIKNGTTVGTAWLIDAGGLLLTAGHLLGTEAPLEQVEVKFLEDIPRKAHKIHWGYQRDMGIDYAVLQVADWSADRQPLPVSLNNNISGSFRARGYGLSLHDQSAGTGDYIGPLDLQNSPDYRLIMLRSAELGEAGYSGAAIFSEELQAVIGFQIEATTAEVGAGRDTILVMPLYRIAQFLGMFQQIAKTETASIMQDCDYDYDVLVTYAENLSGQWVRRYFHPLLAWLLEDALGRRPSISLIDITGEESIHPSHEFKDALAHSRCLVPIWSPSYFESTLGHYACLVMRIREHVTDCGTRANPIRLIFPVVVSDGHGFPQFTNEFHPPLNCRNYMIQVPAFESTEAYLHFRQDMTTWVNSNLVDAITYAPGCRTEWITVEVQVPAIQKPKCRLPILGKVF